jgi:hypothetical protein
MLIGWEGNIKTLQVDEEYVLKKKKNLVYKKSRMGTHPSKAQGK